MVSQRIESLTSRQWAQVERFKDPWLARQTEQYTDAEIAEALGDMWARFGHPRPKVRVADSPLAAMRLAGDVPYYASWWWSAWAGWYRGAELVGVEFDSETLEAFDQWCWKCPFVALSDSPVVSRRPVEVHWQAGELHCDTGPSVRFRDGWGVYSISGVRVTEQIVMRPETLTVAQIRAEDSEEVRRIAIERYGWDKFLKATRAKVLDRRRNDIEATEEALFECEGIRVLVCGCPSTARVYFLEVPQGVSTCGEAQSWVRNAPDGKCVGAS
jgi:hypothetical protein